jgi:hypothetical protein
MGKNSLCRIIRMRIRTLSYVQANNTQTKSKRSKLSKTKIHKMHVFTARLEGPATDQMPRKVHGNLFSLEIHDRCGLS